MHFTTAGGIVNSEKVGKNYPGVLGKRIRVQCFPLYSVLMALGNPTIHYFSLDIEGAELMVSDNNSNYLETLSYIMSFRY